MVCCPSTHHFTTRRYYQKSFPPKFLAMGNHHGPEFNGFPVPISLVFLDYWLFCFSPNFWTDCKEEKTFSISPPLPTADRGSCPSFWVHDSLESNRIYAKRTPVNCATTIGSATGRTAVILVEFRRLIVYRLELIGVPAGCRVPALVRTLVGSLNKAPKSFCILTIYLELKKLPRDGGIAAAWLRFSGFQ